MSKKLAGKTNFRVVVEPRGLGDFGSISVGDRFFGQSEQEIERDYMARCTGIVDDLKRHVDNVARAYVEFDQGHVCEHCGRDWTETSAEYNGGCCEADEVAEMTRNPEAYANG